MRVKEMIARNTRLPGQLLARTLFEGTPERVAPRLLGKLLVRRVGERELLAGRIVEVEAYLGPHHETPDPAAHSHRGPTPRNQVLFGPAGHAYVYAIYGRYFCMNIACEPEGRAGCILVRALEPVMGMEQMARNRGLPALEFREGHNRAFPPLPLERRKDGAPDLRMLAGGPSRLCQALGITRAAHNGLDLLDARSALQVRDDGFCAGRVRVTARIGIRHAAELPLRFCLDGHGCMSGPRQMRGLVMVLG